MPKVSSFTLVTNLTDVAARFPVLVPTGNPLSPYLQSLVDIQTIFNRQDFVVGNSFAGAPEASPVALARFGLRYSGELRISFGDQEDVPYQWRFNRNSLSHDLTAVAPINVSGAGEVSVAAHKFKDGSGNVLFQGQMEAIANASATTGDNTRAINELLTALRNQGILVA